MAARLRRLADRCVFGAARPAPPALTQRLPGTVGAVRFRSVKTKPPLRLLSEARARARNHQLDPSSNPGRPLSPSQLYNITQAVLEKIAPPPIAAHDADRLFYTSTNSLPADWYHCHPLPAAQIQQAFGDFRVQVLRSIKKSELLAPGTCVTSKDSLAAAVGQPGGLNHYLARLFLDSLEGAATPTSSARQRALERAADLRFPQEWYPVTRQFQRTWYLHVGPTNSGKTYHALQRLMRSGNGCYAGPLRLLAHEVFERMNAQGIPCNLVTGDDRRIVSETAALASSTVEMVDLGRRMDVCVLDEIQMIGDEERGWAWTQALMGVKAQEVHLCGEERTVELIQSLAETMGDKLVINRYSRLGPLEVMGESLRGDLHKLEKGDCVVTFSRKNIFALQREIQEQTGKKCAVIYGSLPPETRSIQAQLFNDPDNDYDLLIASDAVGMGLNLSVKRIIFETTVKWNGTQNVPVSVPAIKQIAGRAGRFRVPGAKTHSPDGTPVAPSVGLVTSLDQVDYGPLKLAMSLTPKPLKTAGLLPSSSHIEDFAALYPPDTPFHVILRDLRHYASTSKSIFHLCSFKDHLKIARALSGIKGLSVSERLQFCMAPISDDFMVQEAALEMAQRLAENKEGSVLSIGALDLDVLDIVNPTESTELRRLEGLHKALLLYLWLSWRFPATFTPRETAQDLKTLCEERIDIALQNVKLSRKKHHMAMENIEEKLADMMTPPEVADREEEGESVVPHVHGEDVVPEMKRGEAGAMV